MTSPPILGALSDICTWGIGFLRGIFNLLMVGCFYLSRVERFRLDINRPLGIRIRLVYLRKHKQPYVVQHASRSCSLNLGMQIGDSLTELVCLILVQKRRAFRPLMAEEVEGPEKHLTLQGIRSRLSN